MLCERKKNALVTYTIHQPPKSGEGLAKLPKVNMYLKLYFLCGTVRLISISCFSHACHALHVYTCLTCYIHKKQVMLTGQTSCELMLAAGHTDNMH